MPIALPPLNMNVDNTNTSSRVFTLVASPAQSGNNYSGIISAIALSANPWNHATISYLTITYNYDKDVSPVAPKIQIAYTLTIPVVPSGKDKLVYINGMNYDAHDRMNCNSLKVNGLPIERFKQHMITHSVATIIIKHLINTLSL